jgi:hypothetical protein
MFAQLERCRYCHRRYPAPFGHRCPRAAGAEEPHEGFEQAFREWLQTSEGRFAQYLAARPAR